MQTSQGEKGVPLCLVHHAVCRSYDPETIIIITPRDITGTRDVTAPNRPPLPRYLYPRHEDMFSYISCDLCTTALSLFRTDRIYVSHPRNLIRKATRYLFLLQMPTRTSFSRGSIQSDAWYVRMYKNELHVTRRFDLTLLNHFQ